MSLRKASQWGALLGATALVLSACADESQGDNSQDSSASYPSGPIELVVPTAPGSSADRTVRKIAPLLETELDETVTVRNRPGGSGLVAMNYAQQQPADGQTWTLEGTGMPAVLAVNDTQIDMEDFEPVTKIELDPFVLYVHPDNPADTLDEFIENAAQNPGSVTVGGYGSGSPHHLTTAQLADKSDVELRWVPYESGSDAVTDLIGKNLDAVLSNASQIPAFGDELKPLAHTADEQIPHAPELPSFADEGYPDLTRYHWRGVLAKAGTPPDVLDEMHAAISAAVKSEEFQQYLQETGTIPGVVPRDEMKAQLAQQTESDLAILRDLGMLE